MKKTIWELVPIDDYTLRGYLNVSDVNLRPHWEGLTAEQQVNLLIRWHDEQLEGAKNTMLLIRRAI